MRMFSRRVLALGALMAAAVPSLSSPVQGAEDIVYKEEPVKALPPSPAGAQVASFDPQSLVPYFPDGPLAQARERLRSGDAAGAAQLLGELWQQPDSAASIKSSIHARFLLAVAQLRAAQTPGASHETVALAKQAAAHFDELIKSYPLLISYHTLFAGRAYLLAGQPQQAVARAEKVPSDSVLDCEARYLRAEAQRQLGAEPDSAQKPAHGKPAKDTKSRGPRELAVQSYTGFLAACPGSLHRRDAELALAQQLDTLARPSEALVIWRRLYLEVPDEIYGSLAGKRLEQPATGGSANMSTRVAPFTAAELLTRAQALFDHMRNPESEAAYRWVLEQPELDDAQRCVASYQLAQSVFKQRQRPRAAALFDDAAASCGPSAAKNDDLHMKALYQSARCHASSGELQRAADLFAAAEVAHPGHSYADDSRLRQAEIYSDLSDRLLKDGAKKTCQADTCPDYEAQLISLLSDLPERYPSGDKRAEALWRLALRSLRKRDLGAARNWLDTALNKLPREVGWDQEGRTLYWLGRVAEIQGDRAAATRYYGRTAQEYPLSFYTLMALSRLRVGSPLDFDRVVGELQRPAAGDTGALTFEFKPRALFSHEAFQRGLELLRLGLGSEARREFQSIGIGVADAKAVAAPSPQSESEELLWLASVLFDRAGAWYLSHAIPRHLLTEWQRHYPNGSWRKYWLLAYPRGFYEILAAAARENGQPEALQLAIVREESAFDPRTESFANAVGLTQMIQPTAKRFANGLPFDRESLRDPAINAAIGARFLGFIWGIWQQNPSLAVPSYNAGEGRVVQWLKANITQPLLASPVGTAGTAPPARPPAAEALDPVLNQLDLFVESIPFDETRGYTKRVLASFLTYQWLYGEQLPGKVPPIVFQLPPPPRLRG